MYLTVSSLSPHCLMSGYAVLSDAVLSDAVLSDAVLSDAVLRDAPSRNHLINTNLVLS